MIRRRLVNLVRYSSNEAATPEKLSREMRKQLRKSGGSVSASAELRGSSPLSRIAKGVAGLGVVGTGAWFGALDDSSRASCKRFLMSTPLGDLYEYIFVQIEAIAKPFTEPALEKLLPDWPNGIPGIPPNVPAPPTLVLDLEDTLLHSEWSVRDLSGCLLF